MRKINLLNPKKIVFGKKSLDNLQEDLKSLGFKKIYILALEPILPSLEKVLNDFENSKIETSINTSIEKEPDYETFENLLSEARAFKPDAVIGIGGGSVLDVSKLIAAQLNNDQPLQEIIGIGKLKQRSTYLACMPTTSGTGSEVSPNAILLDPSDELKKGVISPHLVPDASYIDPSLTLTVPTAVTAATGIDALTHCIEAFTNKFAHPIIDLYALEGIKLIGNNLITAVKNGKDENAREALSLGSLYGGICLGPVNTAAVHALSYPLGGEFHIAHGLSNAVLLPHVMRFNLDAAPERFSQVALALGVEEKDINLKTAEAGIEKIELLIHECGISDGLSKLGIPEDSLEHLAEMAMNVTRLLKNNIKPITKIDALEIFKKAY